MSLEEGLKKIFYDEKIPNLQTQETYGTLFGLKFYSLITKKHISEPLKSTNSSTSDKTKKRVISELSSYFSSVNTKSTDELKEEINNLTNLIENDERGFSSFGSRLLEEVDGLDIYDAVTKGIKEYVSKVKETDKNSPFRHSIKVMYNSIDKELKKILYE